MSRWIAGLVLFAGCSGPGVSGDASLRVGVAEVDITPPVGYRMAGYFHERRNTGTKDPLKAKAMVLAQGGTKIALVFCDLIGVPAAVSTPARESAAAKTGIPASHISIAATHSHTGPLYYGMMNKILSERARATEFDYPSMLIERIVQAVEKAQEALVRAELRSGMALETRLSFNRRFLMKDGTTRTNPGVLNPEIVKPMGPIDPEFGILYVLASNKAYVGEPGWVDFPIPFAALTVFACHCDTVGGTEYSADYPGHLSKGIREVLGPGFTPLFGAGTCGNINHIDVTTKERQKTEAIGATLAKDVVAALPTLEPVRSSLAMKSVRLDLPVQRVSAEQISEARAKVDKVGTKDLPSLEQVRTCTVLHLADLPERWSLEVQAIRLGPDTAIVTLPGEVFVEHGLAIKKASPFKHTFVIELANDNCAYVPTREAFAQGAYEVINSRLQPGSGEMMVDAALALLRELAR